LDLGYSNVLGVANNNSTPGFLNKLNFTATGKVRIFFNSSIILQSIPDFYCLDSLEVNFIKWRLSRPDRKYFICNVKDRFHYFTITNRIYVYLGYTSKENYIDLPLIKMAHAPMFFFIISASYLHFSTGVAIPEFLMPSPWNCIELTLVDETNPSQTPNKMITSFEMDTF
jgi:hypothetical protein